MKAVGRFSSWVDRLRRLEPSGVAARLRGGIAGWRLSARGLRVGRNVEFVCPSKIELGEGVWFAGNAYVNAGGPNGSVSIGERSHFDQFCVLYGQGGLRIGSGCAFASGVTVYTQTNQAEAQLGKPVIEQPVLYAPVTIGDDVWVGARAVILPGVAVGPHAVIGAGAVVRDDVPEWGIVAGVPARLVRMRRH